MQEVPGILRYGDPCRPVTDVVEPGGLLPLSPSTEQPRVAQTRGRSPQPSGRDGATATAGLHQASRTSRRRTRLLAATAGIGLSGLLVLWATAQALDADVGSGPAAPPTSESTQVAGSPAGLVPGQETVECVTLTHQVDQPASARLHAVTRPGESGDLAAHLQVRIERFDMLDDCVDEDAGLLLFDGWLAARAGALTRDHGPDDPGLPTGWLPDQTGEQATFRITYTITGGNEVQGRSTTPTLTWRFE